ncbi:hypothetical protein JCM24511_07230 [Saitozyma sp. JCM 24511]|nr:hypothetical protein JCM24511_07230 [Saitozyma sp. JCM 24511]
MLRRAPRDSAVNNCPNQELTFNVPSGVVVTDSQNGNLTSGPVSGLTIPVTCWDGDDGAAWYNFSSRVYANGDNGANSEPTNLLNASCGVRQLDKQSGGTLSLDFLTTAPWVTLNGTVSSGVTIECESVPATIPTCTTDEYYWTIVGVLSPEEVNVTVSGSGYTLSNRTENLPDPEVLAFEMNCTTPQTVQLNADYYNSTGDFSTLTPYKKFECDLSVVPDALGMVLIEFMTTPPYWKIWGDSGETWLNCTRS